MTVAIIAFGTAFAGLILLMFFSMVLGPAFRLFERGASSLSKAESKEAGRDKALAAAIAVTISLADKEAQGTDLPPRGEPQSS